MTRKTLIPAALVLGTVLSGTVTQAQAACMAEYKAKRDNPLELYYDVAQIPGPCTQANATAQLQAMLAAQGLTLLKVLSVTES
ncbi:MAG: hypothetical protein AB8B82_08270 [Roseovarius sp.]